MRMIGHMEGEAQARLFSDFLLVQGIENQVEADKDGAWSVWIHAEEELERAKALLAEYRQNPADPKYRKVAGAAGDLKEQKRREQLDYEKRLKKRGHLFRSITGYGFGPVTFILIFISGAVFVASNFATNLEAVHKLFISEVDLKTGGALSAWEVFRLHISHWRTILPEIRHGEVWRLFTPMFLHFSFLHILFNLLWLRDLGSMIEARQNSFVLLLLVLAIAAGSDCAQFLFKGPVFGGMSGVVYGLMGYIWIRGRLDPGSGLFLHPSTVTMMIVWFFLCLTGLVGQIANYAHAAGLLMGMAWGALSSLRYR
jgi:GlpG protein